MRVYYEQHIMHSPGLTEMKYADEVILEPNVRVDFATQEKSDPRERVG